MNSRVKLLNEHTFHSCGNNNLARVSLSLPRAVTLLARDVSYFAQTENAFFNLVCLFLCVVLHSHILILSNTTPEISTSYTGLRTQLDLFIVSRHISQDVWESSLITHD